MVVRHKAVGRIIDFKVVAIGEPIIYCLAMIRKMVKVDPLGSRLADTAIVNPAMHDTVKGDSPLVRVLDVTPNDAYPCDGWPRGSGVVGVGALSHQGTMIGVVFRCEFPLASVHIKSDVLQSDVLRISLDDHTVEDHDHLGTLGGGVLDGLR